MNNYTKLMTATGYYCNMCDTYHTDNDIKHRYTVESVGVWDGSNGVIVAHEIECPTCRHDDELEKFDAFQWSHLRAFHKATGMPMTFTYPLFDRDTDGPTYGYAETASVDELERIADLYCIDVLSFSEADGDIKVLVDFQ
jgi:hypothetical protein